MFYRQLNTTERTNFNHWVIDIAWFGLAFAATNRFLSVFAIRLGASSTEIALLSSIPALLLLLTSSLGGWWRSRYSTTLRALMPVGFIVRLPFLLPAFAPLFPPRWQPIWLILSVSLPALVQGIASVTFTVFMRETVTNTMMTPLLSLRSLSLNVGVGIGALVFGVWLENAPFPLNYQSMFLLSFVFALMSLYHLSRCKVIEVCPTTKKGTSPLVAWSAPSFRPVIFASGVSHLAFTILAPIIPLYLVRARGASEGFIAIFSLAELIAAAAIGLISARLVKRLGNRAVIALSMVGTGVGILLIVIAPTIELTLFGALMTGAAWTTAAMVGLFGYMMEKSDPERMSSYSAAYNQIIGLAAFLGPMIGSMLLDSGIQLGGVMVIGATARIMAGILTEASLFSRVYHRRKVAPTTAH